MSKHECNYYCQPEKYIHAIKGIANSEVHATLESVQSLQQDLERCTLMGLNIKKVLSVHKSEANVKEWVDRAKKENWVGNHKADKVPFIMIVELEP